MNMQKRLFVSFFLFLLLGNISGQEKSEDNKDSYPSNTIKGLYIPLQFYKMGFISYERMLSKNSSIGINISNLYIQDIQQDREPSPHNKLVSILEINYKYYPNFENLLFRNTWGSLGIGMMKYLTTEYRGMNQYGFGLSLSTGKRFHFGSKKRIFLDLGFGFIFGTETKDYYLHGIKERSPKILPKPIFMLGYKF